jgi:hypothetical protein
MTARSVLGAAAARLVLSAQFVGEDALLAVLERDLAQAEDADDGA